MNVDIRRTVALAELIAAVSAYQDVLLGICEEDDDALAEMERMQLAIARAFLRLSGIAARPDQLFDELPQTSVDSLQRLAATYRKTPIPSELRWAVFRRDHFTCKQCGLQEDLHADHVVPESKGGPTTLENLQTLCGGCNRKKGARA